MLGREFFLSTPKKQAFCYTQHHFYDQKSQETHAIVEVRGAGYTSDAMTRLFPTISRREWVGAALVGLLAALVGSWPWLMSAWQAQTGLVFLGTNVPDVLDSQVYYAFIQGSASHGAYANLFTNEAQSAALWNPLWWVLGQGVRWANLSPVTVFWAAKAILGFGLVLLIYRLAAVFFQRPTWRFLALGLAIFGSGFGWLALTALHAQPGLVWLYQRTDLISILPTDLTYSAGYVWMSILHSPLFVLAEILLLGIWSFAALAISTSKKYFIHLAGGVTLLLGFVHPYDLVLMFGVLVGASIIGIVGETMNQAQVKKLLQTFVWLIVWSLPAVIYYALLVFFVPSISEWNTNNLLQTTNFRNVLVGFGGLTFLVAIGIQAWWKKNRSGMYLIAWLGAAIMLMYLPLLRWQAKMIIGLSLPVGLLATAGAEAVWQKRKGGLNKIFVIGCTLAVILTPVIFLTRVTESQTAEQRYHYAPTEVITALQWIKKNTPRESIILGDIWTGNLVPQFAERATYLGHHHQTNHYREKLAAVRGHFFTDAGTVAEKEQWLKTNGIDYVFFGPNERRLSQYTVAALPILEGVYANDLVSVFRVGR